jgi:hypothetical protein
MSPRYTVDYIAYCNDPLAASILLAFQNAMTHNQTVTMRVAELLDILYGLIVSPARTFQSVSYRRPWLWALTTELLISLIFAFVLLPYPPQLAGIILQVGRDTLPLVPVVLVWIVMFLIILSVQAVLFHLLATLFRGKGTYRGMLCSLCFVWLPSFFVAPLALLRAVLDSYSGHILYIAGSSILCLWVLFLYFIAIRQNYQISSIRATVTCFIPLFLMFALPPLVVALRVA